MVLTLWVAFFRLSVYIEAKNIRNTQKYTTERREEALNNRNKNGKRKTQSNQGAKHRKASQNIAHALESSYQKHQYSTRTRVQTHTNTSTS